MTSNSIDNAMLQSVLGHFVTKIDFQVVAEEVGLPTKDSARVRWGRLKKKIDELVLADHRRGKSVQRANQVMSPEPADESMSPEPADESMSTEFADEVMFTQPANEGMSTRPATNKRKAPHEEVGESSAMGAKRRYGEDRYTKGKFPAYFSSDSDDDMEFGPPPVKKDPSDKTQAKPAKDKTAKAKPAKAKPTKPAKAKPARAKPARAKPAKAKPAKAPKAAPKKQAPVDAEADYVK